MSAESRKISRRRRKLLFAYKMRTWGMYPTSERMLLELAEDVEDGQARE